MSTVSETPVRDEDVRRMNEEEKIANSKFRSTFASTLRGVLSTIGVFEPHPFLHEFDRLALNVKPDQVEILAAFLEGVLLPPCVAMLFPYIRRKRHEDQNRRNCKRPKEIYYHILNFFTKRYLKLFTLIKEYHLTGRRVDEVKLLELHLSLLVTFKTETCHFPGITGGLRYREGQESTGTNSDGRCLTHRALKAIEISFPLFVKVDRGWIIHSNIGPHLIHAIHAIRLLRVQNRTRRSQLMEAIPNKDTSFIIPRSELKKFQTVIDAIIQRDVIAKMRPGMGSCILERQIERIISYYRKMDLKACVGHIPRCLGLETRGVIDDYLTKWRGEQLKAFRSKQRIKEGEEIDESLRSKKPTKPPRHVRIKEMLENGKHHCLVRNLCDLAIPAIVARTDEVVPEKVNYDVFNMIVVQVAALSGIEIKTDQGRQCGFRVKRCPCWDGYRAAVEIGSLVAPIQVERIGGGVEVISIGQS